MVRAAVLIGVKNSGTLPKLQAVDAGLAAMTTWVTDQGISPALTRVLSDQSGTPVRAAEIYTAIEAMTQKQTVEQLIVYFSGHGVNKALNEFWLLSDAPGNPNEAVNVSGSAVLAEAGGIPHVVFVSDACRTAPTGIQAQAVTGSLVFPNEPPSGPARSVDQFYACLLGDPSQEIPDPDEASRVYHAIYTEALLQALRGHFPDLLDEVEEGGQRIGYVRPWPLKRRLPSLVTNRLKDLQALLVASQTPDAKLSSDPDVAWLSRIPLTAGRRGVTRGRRITGSAQGEMADQADAELDLTLLGTDRQSLPLNRGLDHVTTVSVRAAADDLDQEFGPGHYETGSGFKLRGEEVVQAWSPDAGVELLDPALVRVTLGDRPASTVIMLLASGRGIAIPTVQDFMCALTFDSGQLVDVSYEPVDTGPRWHAYQRKRAKLRRVRAVIAAASRYGMFRLEGDRAEALAREMQVEKSLDPSLALYAAYAYHDLGLRDRVATMQRYLTEDLGFLFFDLAMLSRDPRPGALPVFGPLLSRGWALLPAFGLELPGALRHLPQMVAPSLWTLYEPPGLDLILQEVF